MIFLSQILNLPVVNSRQDEIGRLKDVLVQVNEQAKYPEVSGIVVKAGRKESVIPYKFIENLGYGEITLKKSDCGIDDYKFSNSETLLARDLLDQQIFDVGGIRVVRVNDLELIKIEEKFLLMSIDISNRALLRRLGLAHIPFFRKSKSHFIDWGNVSLVKGLAGNLQLKTSKAKLEKLHPADIANLIENLNFQESTNLVQSLDEGTAAEVLEEVEPEYKDALLQRINPANLAEIVEEMPTDEAADVIQALSEHKKIQLFKRLGVRKARELHNLSKYKEDTAGGMMNSEFMSVHNDVTVQQAAVRIRKASEQHSSIYHVFITDEDKHLEGIVSIRTLLLAKHREKISSIMSKVYHTVRTGTDVEEVARVMTKYNLLSVAVTDRKKVIKGIITVDDILRYLIPDA
jgi:magnesium transporter